jgi:hypothetical protein
MTVAAGATWIDVLALAAAIAATAHVLLSFERGRDGGKAAS